MTIREIDGDILRSKMQTLVNPVNCVGAMGAGLALAFKECYPRYYDAYRVACKLDVLKDDLHFVYDVSERRKIYSLPTKLHWKEESNTFFIERALRVLVRSVKRHGITSLAVPALGCGKGKLTWEEMRPLLYKWLSRLDIEIELYLP